MLVIVGEGDETIEAAVEMVTGVREESSQIFVAVFSATATDDAPGRLALFDAGANMVGAKASDLVATLTSLVTDVVRCPGVFACPICHLLCDEDGLWTHFPMWHINSTPPWGVCSTTHDGGAWRDVRCGGGGWILVRPRGCRARITHNTHTHTHSHTHTHRQELGWRVHNLRRHGEAESAGSHSKPARPAGPWRDAQ